MSGNVAKLLSISPSTDCLVLQVSSSELDTFESNFTALVAECSSLRKTDAIQFGETQFANTTDQVIAFTRLVSCIHNNVYLRYSEPT